MSATRDARTAKRKLAELGIVSATVLTGSTTITIDLAAFDELVSMVPEQYQPSVSSQAPRRPRKIETGQCLAR